MSKFTEQLRGVGVVNAYDFARQGETFIAFVPRSPGRGCLPARVQVVRWGFLTDQKSAWYDYGNKSFSTMAGKDAAFAEAKEWAGKRYGITEWARTPFGTWMDADFVKRRTAELKALIRDAQRAEADHA